MRLRPSIDECCRDAVRLAGGDTAAAIPIAARLLRSAGWRVRRVGRIYAERGLVIGVDWQLCEEG